MRNAMLMGLVLVLGAGTAAATGRFDDARGKAGLKALGFKVYWSLLDDGQKAEAKEIVADHLAATGPDRLAAAARLLRYRADVAALLTKEQRAKALKIAFTVKKLPKERRIALLDRLLDKTDRAALANRLEGLIDASPEARVGGGLDVLDQLHALLLAEAATRLGLTADQTARIDALYRELRTDIEPIALRLAQAKDDAVRKGLSILDETQKAKLELVKDAVIEKVLAFLRG